MRGWGPRVCTEDTEWRAFSLVWHNIWCYIGVMAEGTTSENVPELILRIRQMQEAGDRFPPKVHLDFNVPIWVKRRLKQAARRHQVTQTEILVSLLEENLPKLLNEQSGELFTAAD